MFSIINCTNNPNRSKISNKKFTISITSNCVLLIQLAFIILTVGINPHKCQEDAGKDEVFSSTRELQKLLNIEGQVVAKLEEYADELKKELGLINNYISDYNLVKHDEDGNTENDADIVSNPFNAFHILKRTTVDWDEVVSTIKNQTKSHGLAEEVISKSELLPKFEDFVGGSMALVGLQDTYGFNLTELIHGTIGNTINLQDKHFQYELSARDCLFLGKAAFNKGLYDRAISWLETALSRSEEEENTTATKNEILPFLETTKRVHDEVLEKRGPFGETWQTFLKPVNAVLARKKRFQKIKAYKPKIYELIPPHEENENFKRLCRHETLRSPKMDARLRCRYRTRTNTISIVGPFKIEELSLTPYIIIFHDFMTDEEMELFRKTASSRLKRSLHQGKNGQYVATDVRTSKQAWLTSDDNPLIEKVTHRIGEATGLATFPENEASELFQVANYGMAGRYTPHTDFITGQDHYTNPIEIKRGNRIATFMIYLENVHAGGSTVFPLIGVKVRPEKGSAVFWWNLKRDGEGDPWTRHGACPVIYGEKWISNKWIRTNHQFQKVPCLPLNEEQYIREI